MEREKRKLLQSFVNVITTQHMYKAEKNQEWEPSYNVAASPRIKTSYILQMVGYRFIIIYYYSYLLYIYLMKHLHLLVEKQKEKVSSQLECYGMKPSREDLQKMLPVLSFSFYAKTEISIILCFGPTIALVKIRIGFFTPP